MGETSGERENEKKSGAMRKNRARRKRGGEDDTERGEESARERFNKPSHERNLI
jgi:hypothetical protein